MESDNILRPDDLAAVSDRIQSCGEPPNFVVEQVAHLAAEIEAANGEGGTACGFFALAIIAAMVGGAIYLFVQFLLK